MFKDSPQVLQAAIHCFNGDDCSMSFSVILMTPSKLVGLNQVSCCIPSLLPENGQYSLLFKEKWTCLPLAADWHNYAKFTGDRNTQCKHSFNHNIPKNEVHSRNTRQISIQDPQKQQYAWDVNLQETLNWYWWSMLNTVKPSIQKVDDFFRYQMEYESRSES